MKRKTIFAIIGLSLLFTGCNTKGNVVTEFYPVEHTTYITSGRYYTSGEVITEDGNVWGYSQDVISERESYDNEPIFALFDDNGTPENIYDDEIYGVVLDRETEVYDRLEAELSKSFAVERNGNNISISQRR